MYGFAELPSQLQRRILDYRLFAHIFPVSTEDTQILEVFARLNATGTVLKPQELRNAKWYGEFKTLSFSLATRHLEFWLSSRIFTAEKIARMDEVELSSDLVLTIMRGIGEGSKATLDTAYKNFDDSLPNASEIEVRFDATVGAIRSHFEFSTAPRFQNRNLFFCLFAAYYDVLYGLGSSLDAKKKPNESEVKFLSIARAAVKVSDLSAPAAVVSATQRRLTHRSERQRVVSYLLGGRNGK